MSSNEHISDASPARGTARPEVTADGGRPDDSVASFRVDVAALPDIVLAIDDDGVISYVNDRLVEAFGWPANELVGASVLDLIHPDDLNLAAASMETVQGKDVGQLVRIRAHTAGGDWRPLEVRGSRTTGDDGRAHTVLVCRDIADRHHLDLDQGETAVLRAVMANMHGMVAIIEPDMRVRSINGAVTRVLGHDPEVAPGQHFIDFLHEDDRDQFVRTIETLRPHDAAAVEARLATRHPGEYVTCEFTVNNLTADPVIRGFIISGQVSAALSDARARVAFLAEYDSLTGLRNRTGFLKAAAGLIGRGTGLGLLVIDISQFRSINDLYGERVGDAVLAALAARIDEIRWPDLVTARFGGDEFVLAMRSDSDASVQMLRSHVRREIGRPVRVDDQEIIVALRTAAAFEERPTGLESLLASANNELVRVKRNDEHEAGGISAEAIDARRRQLDQLRAALDTGEIQPFFQPIVDGNGTITAFEALVRWVHPVRGILGASEILPLAQMAGLMRAIDDRSLDLALRFARRLAESGSPDVEVHVNVDPRLIAEAEFASRFLHRCGRVGADPGQIVVEITETDLLAPGAISLTNMQELRRAGTHVSIDDFGTGYSSLAHLLELPVDGVKIDRRFVAGIDVDPAATNLTTAILGLSESLHLGCVAEGVEQPYQRDRLEALGCTAFQGWLFAPAVSADEAMDMLPRLDAVPAPTPG